MSEGGHIVIPEMLERNQLNVLTMKQLIALGANLDNTTKKGFLINSIIRQKGLTNDR